MYFEISNCTLPEFLYSNIFNTDPNRRGQAIEFEELLDAAINEALKNIDELVNEMVDLHDIRANDFEISPKVETILAKKEYMALRNM